MRKGFTLIELLIVIVIIGILAGVVLAVMNPAEQQRKANESVLRSNTDKICLAMHACAASRSDADTACITFAGIGVNDPSGTPTGSDYRIGLVGSEIQVTGDSNTAATAGGCEFRCIYDTTDGSSAKVAPVTPANCAIE